jgi:asparagine synthase (glutamine-hydrolysing)
MCGITGKLSFDGRAADPNVLRRMCDSMLRRGPDDEGIYARGPVGLGQRRLSIIDLRESACAPLSNEDETLWIVLNGEIYNFQTLRAELQQRGHRFRTDSDTEVLLHMYQEYGAKCLDRLRGMFAFAIWDERRQVLFAARDRLGKKPFVYYHERRGLWFGSQVRAILSDPDVPAAPDYAAIDLYLSRQYVPSPMTAYAGIRKLPAGHYLECRLGEEPKIVRYWSPPRQPTVGKVSDPRELQQMLLAKLEESVRLRMIADVPLGALLSAGIDSAAVVAMMARNSDRPVKTYSIGFHEKEFDELEGARLIAQRYGTEHHEFMVELTGGELLDNVIGEFDEPFADASALPTYFVAKLAASHVKVVLSGDGGDESFAGYGHYGNAMRWNRLDRVPKLLRRAAAGVGAFGTALLPVGSTVLRARNWFDLLGSDWPHRYRENTAVLKLPERAALYAATMRERGLPVTDSAALDIGSSGEPPLGWMMRYDQSHYLADCLMTKTDVCSMAHSLEARCPLLDHELVEFAATIPLEQRYANGRSKAILRDALRELLPEQTLVRKKTGFGIPLAAWLRSGMREQMQALLLDSAAGSRGLFRRGVVQMMVDQHLQQSRDWSMRLWTLMCLEMWFRRFIDGGARGK